MIAHRSATGTLPPYDIIVFLPLVMVLKISPSAILRMRSSCKVTTVFKPYCLAIPLPAAVNPWQTEQVMLKRCRPRCINSAVTRTGMPASTKIRRKPRNISILLVDDGDVQPAGFQQQILRFYFAETRIARFDGEEKSVVGGAGKTIPVKNGMMPAGQSVHDQVGKKSGKGREEHRQFEHNREKSRHCCPVERFSVHDHRINEPGRTEFENNSGQQTGDATDQHHRAEPRFAKSHRFIHSVNGKG